MQLSRSKLSICKREVTHADKWKFVSKIGFVAKIGIEIVELCFIIS